MKAEQSGLQVGEHRERVVAGAGGLVAQRGFATRMARDPRIVTDRAHDVADALQKTDATAYDIYARFGRSCALSGRL